jgi:hypothetical protein
MRVRSENSEGIYSSGDAVVAVTVPDQAPVALPDSFTIYNDPDFPPAGTALSVLSNDYHLGVAASGLSVNEYSEPSHGTLTLSNGTLSYTPDEGYLGSDMFTYTCSDGILTSQTTTVNLNISNLSVVNAVEGTSSIEFNSSYNGTSISNISLIEAPSVGTVNTSTDSNITTYYYTPPSTFVGTVEAVFTSTSTDDPSCVTVSNRYITITPLITVDSDNAALSTNVNVTDPDYYLSNLTIADDETSKHDLSGQGVVVQDNNGDDNSNGIPDNVEGLGNGSAGLHLFQTQLTPFKINLPTFNYANATVTISYDASDPSQVTISGAGTASDPYLYSLPADGGVLRIWTPSAQGYGDDYYPQWGGSPESFANVTGTIPYPVNSPGYYVPPGTYPLSDFSPYITLSSTGYSITLYMERVAPSQNNSQREVSVSVNSAMTGQGVSSDYFVAGDDLGVNLGTLSDGVVESPIIGYSSQFGPSYETVAADGSMVVNDRSISLGDGFAMPGYANGIGSNPWVPSAAVAFVPLEITIPEGVDPNGLQISLVYDGSDPNDMQSASAATPYALPNTGSIRVWSKDGTEQRNSDGIVDGGSYITPGIAFPGSSLTWASTSQGDETVSQATVYIEAVKGLPGLLEYASVMVDVSGHESYVNPASMNSADISWDTQLTNNYTVRLKILTDQVPDYSPDNDAISLAVGAGGNNAGSSFIGSVNLSQDSVVQDSPDITTSGFGMAWGQTRVYRNDVTAALFNPSYGADTVVQELPELLQAGSTIIAVIGDTTLYFDQTSSGSYVERFFGYETLTHESGDSQFTLTESDGTRISFNDFTTDADRGKYWYGNFKSITDVNGNTASVNGYDSLGNILSVIHGGDTFTYSYVDATATELLQKVKLARSGYVVQEVDYVYYPGTSYLGEFLGGFSDLALVTIINLGVVISHDFYTYTGWVNGSITYGNLLTTALTGDAYAKYAASISYLGDPSTLALTGVGAPGSYANYIVAYSYLGGVLTIALPGATVLNGATVEAYQAYTLYTLHYDDTLGDGGFGAGIAGSAVTVVSQDAYPSEFYFVSAPTVDATSESYYFNFGGEVLLDDLHDTQDVDASLEGQNWDIFNVYDWRGRMLWTADPSTQISFDPTASALVVPAAQSIPYSEPSAPAGPWRGCRLRMPSR